MIQVFHFASGGVYLNLFHLLLATTYILLLKLILIKLNWHHNTNCTWFTDYVNSKLLHEHNLEVTVDLLITHWLCNLRRLYKLNRNCKYFFLNYNYASLYSATLWQLTIKRNLGNILFWYCIYIFFYAIWNKYELIFSSI